MRTVKKRWPSVQMSNRQRISHVGAAVSAALSNIHPGLGEPTVSDGATKLADVKLLGHYDQTPSTIWART
jgi:hypothetical protein